MTLLFPDVNLWLALSVADHTHNSVAWRWLKLLADDRKLAISRYTQLGLLRLLTSSPVMGDQTLRLGQAWSVYDHWLEDPRVAFYAEPRNVETAFRLITEPFDKQKATKAVGDCWLLAFAKEIDATLVTFDRALFAFARKQGLGAIIPS